MKLIHVKRTTRIENRYTRKMGNLKTNVTRIKKYFINIPVKTNSQLQQTLLRRGKKIAKNVL
jgi:hypothetical protein